MKINNYSVLHDSYLTGIELQRSEILLSFTAENGMKYKLDVSGVQAMLIQNVRLGNIILEIKEMDCSCVSDEELSFLLFHKAMIESEVLESKKAELSANGLRMLSIQSSYGAEGLVLCKSHILEKSQTG